MDGRGIEREERGSIGIGNSQLWAVWGQDILPGNMFMKN